MSDEARVVVVDVKIHFWSMVILLVKIVAFILLVAGVVAMVMHH